MLSEQRENRTQRFWSDFSLNPRGELWKKDKQNFGCKLMKKMGWKKETGLGKNGNGITAPIRVVQTHDKEGLGFSKQVSDYSWNWLSHQDDYTSLLRQLQEQHWTTESGSSADQNQSLDNPVTPDSGKRAKTSRKRERYMRNIEGKKMKNRSEADWQCILGKKSSEHTPEETETSNVSENKQELLVTSTVDLRTYFMEKKIKLDVVQRKNGVIPITETNEEKEIPEDISSASRNSEDDVESDTLYTQVQKNKRKRKKRTKEKGKQRKLERKLARQQKKMQSSECEEVQTVRLSTKLSESTSEENCEVDQVLNGGTSSSKPATLTEADTKKDDEVGQAMLNIRMNMPFMGSRTATKYQCFLESIQQDPIFQTCNLLSIKGYGNS